MILGMMIVQAALLAVFVYFMYKAQCNWKESARLMKESRELAERSSECWNKAAEHWRKSMK